MKIAFRAYWFRYIIVGILLTGSGLAILQPYPFLLAQGVSWSEPVMLSTNTISSWFSDVAVDAEGQAYVVWNSGRGSGGEVLDLLMYSAWDGQRWLQPNDVILTAKGGYTIRPALAIDASRTLHLTYRGGTVVYYAQAPADRAAIAFSWTGHRRLSGTGNAYYSDVAVDSNGGIHVVWNEAVADEQHEKVLWFGTISGTTRYNGTEWQNYSPLGWLGNRQVYAMLEDEEGVQWFGTDQGVFRYDGGTWQSFSTRDGLVSDHVYAIVQDWDGALWFGTDRGASRYDPSARADKWKTYTIVDGLAGNEIRAIAVDREGMLWFGTDSGVSRYDGRKWHTYTVQDGLADNKVSAVAVGQENQMWFGTQNGISYFDGMVWTHYTAEDGLADNLVYDVLVDWRRGGVWFGTESGLSYYDGQKWVTYTTKDGLADNIVLTLALDTDGVLWVGTPSGLCRYDRNRWTIYTTQDGLVDNQVQAIVEDRIVNAICPNCADIFYRRSNDGGVHWSAPINLSNSYAGSVKPQIRVDERGGVHVVWEEGEDWYAGAGYPVSSMYIYSPDSGKTWTTPVVFTAPNGASQQITMGIERQDELVVVWRLPTDNKLYYQRSTDKGVSWSEPKPIPGVLAKEWEPMSLDSCDAATDSSGNVHLLVLGRLSELEEGLSLLHLVWDGTVWSSPTRVFVSTDPPEWPRVAIGGGNKLFATWFTRDKAHIKDSERGRYKVWVAGCQLGSPAQTPIPLPTRTPFPTNTPAVKHTPTATPFATLPPDIGGLPDGLYTEADDVLHLLEAIAPIGALLLLIAAIRLGWLRKLVYWILARLGWF